MSSELEYERARNTYYYQLCSKQGNVRAEAFDFDFVIPPFKFPEHNDSDRCIFTLLGCFVSEQAVGAQLGDVGYFTLTVDGIGLSAQNYNTTVSQVGGGGAMVLHEMTPNNSFMIPNTEEEYDSTSTAPAGAPNAGEIFNNVVLQHITGSIDLANPYTLICGNPVGKSVQFVIRNTNGARIADVAALKTIVRFKIEVVPKD